MKWRLVITPRVQEELYKFPPQTKKYIREALDDLRENPAIGKALRDDLAGYFSFRAKRFRIVYEIRHKVVTVVVIGVGPRRTIYERISSEVRMG